MIISIVFYFYEYLMNLNRNNETIEHQKYHFFLNR
jgi:hypothetical protein